MTRQTFSVEDTMDFASSIGIRLRGGECLEFVSDLGGGKTTFIKGLVKGWGSEEVVNSPTFTVGKQYSHSGGKIFHYDFYRLQEPGLVKEELAEALESPKNIIVVEWAESVRHVLPDERIVVHIDKVADDPDRRIFSMSFADKFEYLFKGLRE